MDKNTYETYEFLPLNTGENLPDQYFVVQDDGTLLINRQIQYVTENDDSKENSESCTVDISSQQVFVDVHNSTMTFSDQLIPPVGESNIYNGGFLLQPGTSSSPQQIVNAVIDQADDEVQEMKINVDNVNNKQPSVFTEITLTDEQCRLLEQKGWILLETNDKIYVLNTMGLHDITDNDKLIQKLRTETERTNEHEQHNSCPNILQKCSPIATPPNNLSTVSDINLITNDNSVQQSMKDENDICYVVENEVTEQEMDDQTESNDSLVEAASDDIKNTVVEMNSLKVKTKMLFKDIPDKIFLGKTRNGKNLYAKVKSCSKPIVIYEINENDNVNKVLFDPDMGRTQFLNLVYNINGKIGDRKQLAQNINIARPALAEIFKIPKLRHYIIDQYLFITRITHKIDDTNHMHYKSEPYLLTGIVEVYDSMKWKFVHIPNILDDILKDLILEGSEFQSKEFSMQVSHIHIKEMKATNNIVRVSIILAKQQLCFISVSEKPRRRSPLHACGSCAAVFNSERELEVHQETQCVSTDEPLVIDAVLNESNKPYVTVRNGNEESYCCLQCNAKFSKLTTCEKHINTHYFPNNTKKADVDTTNNSDAEHGDSNMKVYKCTMCPGTYLHSSTYSKHIISQHIKLQLN